MRKIELCKAPVELTPRTVQRLTDEFKTSGKAVWRKEYIKNALLEMTFGKCIYSEVRLGENSTCEEVEHFYPKSIYPDKVLEWGNLMPTCKICNAKKGDVDPNKVELINPYIDNPSDYIAFSGFICVAINRNIKGENSILYYNINNSHFTRPRQHQIELNNEILSRLSEEMSEGLNVGNPTKRFIARIKSVLQSAQPTEPYSVCTGTALLKSGVYKTIREELTRKGLWSSELKLLEDNIDCSLEIR